MGKINLVYSWHFAYHSKTDTATVGQWEFNNDY